MLNFARLSLLLFFTALLICSPANAESRRQIQITYLGNAGWQITNGKTIILVDPFISEFRPAKKREQLSADDPIATPWAAGIDEHIRKADYILITHGHEDHMLDAPYISNRTGATIICSESAANIARAYGIGNIDRNAPDLQAIKDQKLIVVRGGEDYQFDDFSLEVIPSLHTALFDKRYNDGFWADSTPPDLTAPLHESAYAEGGTFIYLLRMDGHKIFIMGSMNYIERNITGLRPDIAIIGAGSSRNEIYHYAATLMHALGNPPIVLPTHWDDFGTKPRSDALKSVHIFGDEIRAASPHTKVIVPDYFVPMSFK